MQKTKHNLGAKFFLICIGILFAIIVIELILQFAALFTNPNIKTYSQNNKKIKIVCVGDSFTYGIGAKQGFSYPEQLQTILNKTQNQPGFEIINCGQPGFNTALTVQRAEEKIIKLNPDILIIMTGLNDFWNLSGLTKNTSDIRLKLNSFFCNFRFYRLIKILLSNPNNKYSVKSINNIDKLSQLTNPKGFEKELKFLNYIKYARHFKLTHEYEKSLIALDLAIKMDYFNQHIFELLDELFIAWHVYPKAICYYEKLYQIYPNDKEINIRLASMYKAVQDYEKSRVFFKKAYDLDPDSKQAIAGIINADNFLKQKINNNFIINPKDLPMACTKKFDPNQIFNQQLVLEEQDYDLLKAIISLQKDSFFQNDEYRASIAPIYKNQLIRLSSLCGQKNIKILLLSYPSFLREYVLDGLKSRNTDFIDLRPQFSKVVNNNNRNEYESLDGHCTAKGYKLIADIISQHILK